MGSKYLQHVCGLTDCKSCGQCDVMELIYERSNFPLNLRSHRLLESCEEDLPSYIRLAEISANIYEFVKAGKWLYIYSSGKGNGKTTWALKIVQQFCSQLSYVMSQTNSYPYENCYFRFVNTSALFNQIRESFNGADPDPSLTKDLIGAKLMVWDDIGAEKPTDFVRDRFYTYLSQRELNQTANIFTSNVTPRQLFESRHIDERILSRLKLCEVIELRGADRRGFNG